MMTEEQKILFDQGKLLPLMEDFYTIQGEGHNTGKPAYFIRLGGCDMGCWWCDVKESWDASLHPLTETSLIIERAAKQPAKAVVVTGGEPVLYNLDYLCNELKEKGIKTYLETAGVKELTGQWDWICLSPKKGSLPLLEYFNRADELKVIIHNEGDFRWAELNAGKAHPNCLLFLQPEWSVHTQILPLIVNYVKENPEWNISLQTHKFMNIP
ncbi:MAG: 7-carboxy-7-deazaguanine synthase QueE [Bacteroidales bacterium]|nr:7-carboxy-7-deazaguanine synthase QueE [Bacteroidales bacterium]